jgi:hypothetical protein
MTMNDMTVFLILGPAVAFALALIWGVRQPLRKRRRVREERVALQAFRVQREQLEAKFFDLASSLGKPRGLRWVGCDWQNSVSFGRDVNTGLLTAFVAVNIRFEAIEGGGMEEVEAVGTIRDAAAVFHYQRGRWGTGGKALFNMNPQDALARLQGQFERVTIT